MAVDRITSQVTAIIKTFERPRSLDRLVRSIRRYSPRLKVIVGDDSVTAYPRADVDYVRLPVDIGLAAGRNALLQLVDTPYFLVLDDDIAFTVGTRIERLVQTLERHDAAVVSGDLVDCERVFPLWTRRRRQTYHGVLRREGDALQLIPGHDSIVGEAYQCDFTPQFFLARTDEIRQLGGWFAPLKMDANQELFLRLKDEGLLVLHRMDVWAEHWQEEPLVYAAFRARDYAPIMASRHGLRRITDFAGNEREFELAEVA
ncbi:MAG TPA: glycosyltransferase family 2 protein [Lacipirellula sp.]